MAMFEFVLPVELPPGMSPEEFMAHTSVEFRKGFAEGTNATSIRYVVSGTLDEHVPKLGKKEMRPVV